MGTSERMFNATYNHNAMAAAVRRGQAEYSALVAAAASPPPPATSAAPPPPPPRPGTAGHLPLYALPMPLTAAGSGAILPSPSGGARRSRSTSPDEWLPPGSGGGDGGSADGGDALVAALAARHPRRQRTLAIAAGASARAALVRPTPHASAARPALTRARRLA